MTITLPTQVSVPTSQSDTEVVFPAGSTHPPLRVQLRDADGDPIDLSDATYVKLQVTDADTTLVDRRVDVIDRRNGVIEYAWRRADTAEAGIYDAQVIVAMADETTLKCPSRRPLTINIT